METINETNLGNLLLSIALASGFIIFIILILRVFLLGINYGLSQVKNRKTEINKSDSDSKGF